MGENHIPSNPCAYVEFNQTVKEYHKNQWKYLKCYFLGKLPDDVEKKMKLEPYTI